MKNIYSMIFMSALLLSGCVQEEISENKAYPDGRQFTASFEEDEETRTYVEDGVLLRWTSGDDISLFDGNTLNRQYRFDGETGDNSGTFSIVSAPYGSGNDLNANYAVYPYSSDVKITESGIVTVTLPEEQKYAENSFGLGANTMVAVTKGTDDTFLRFRNTCGYLKLQLYGEDVTVKSVTLTGNGDEKLAGKAAVTTAYGQEPVVSMSDDAGATIVLDCGEGVKIGSTAENATSFWIVVPAVTFEDGFTVTVEDTDGGTFVKSTSNEIRISRNVIKPMKAFEVEIEKTIPDNQIWYTSSDGKVVDPYIDQYFGATIKSNIYKDGKGIITFDGDVTSIGSNAFRYCSSLTGVTIPGSVTTIATYAFYECSALVDVIIPGSVTKINDFAFAKCASLKNIIIPYGVKNIGGDAFAQCSSLVNVTIPESVKNIGNYAFYVCSSLTEIIIPDSVTSIGSNAFAHCESLANLTIPASVVNIGTEVIRGCVSLSSVVIEPDNKVYDSRNDCNAIIETVSNTLIGGCKSTVIPDGVVEIADDAFRNCETLPYINIPASVTSIGDRAFSNCPSLARMDVKATTPPALGEYAISGTHGDLIVYVPENSVNLYKRTSGWKDLNIMAEPMPNNQIWYTSNDGNVVTPYKSKGFDANIISNVCVEGKGIITFDADITKIYASAFENCATLVDIKLPDSVTYLGSDAFSGCSSLVAIDIPRISTIYEYTFNGCAALSSVTIPDTVTKIEDGAFFGCKSLKTITLPDSLITVGGFMGCEFSEITIPESVKIIGPHAFHNCMNLKEISIPDGVETIGSSAFYNCTGLKTLVIPDNVKVIEDQAFYACSGLTSIIIGDNVRNIGFNAFRKCTGVPTLTLPSCIETIGDSAFADMRLTSMTCLDNYPPASGDPFWSGENNNKIEVLYVPSGAKDNYASNPKWNNYFNSIIELDN